MKRYIYSLFLFSIVATGTAVGAGRVNLNGLGFTAPTIAGKSNVYDAQAGDILYDSTDSTFYGYTHSGAWTSFAGSGGVPAGSIIAYSGTSDPAGYMIADGRAVSRTTYSTLFAAIGTTYGSGDGSTTFNLPDLRGRFLRGVDGAAGVDPNAATRTAMASGGNTGNNVGSVQADAIQGHKHNLTSTAWGLAIAGGSNDAASVGQRESITGTNGPVTDGTNGTPRISSETRPVNAYVNFIIKL